MDEVPEGQQGFELRSKAELRLLDRGGFEEVPDAYEVRDRPPQQRDPDKVIDSTARQGVARAEEEPVTQRVEFRDRGEHTSVVMPQGL